jgi:hypothetical protein
MSRALGGGREQAGAVADVHHRTQQAPGENRYHTAAEGLGLGPSKVELSNVVWVVVIVVLLVVGDPIIRAMSPGLHPWNHGP